jgi:phage I-like protein
MTHSPAFLAALPLALNSEGPAGAPDWVQLTPAGPHLPGIDGRAWTMADPEAVIAACRAIRGGTIEIPVDFEHATQVKGAKGEPAPAVGWIREMEARNGAIWGRVEWTDAGRDAVASRAYRFLSPTFDFNRLTGAMRRIVSAGLTNVPNFTMPAMNRSQEENPMDPEVLKALGLAPDAGPAAAVSAINALKSAEATALNRAETPDPDKWVPKADYELATNRLTDLEAEAKTRAEAEIVAEVDAAVAAGKIAPASKDYHLASCRAEGGLERFRTMIAGAPVIAGKTTAKADPAPTPGKLSADELAVCRQMGMSPEDFAAAKAAEQE